MNLVWRYRSAKYFRFPEACLQYWISHEPWCSESFLRCELSCEQFSLSTFADNFYDAFFWHGLVRNNGIRTCFAKIQDHHLVLWTSGSSTLHLVQVSNEFDAVLFLASWFDSASSASLLIGSRVVKKSVCPLSLRSFPPATNPTSAIEYLTHVVGELFPLVRNHHVIHQSWWDDHSTWMILDRTNISQFSILIFPDLKPCLDASKMKAMEPILVCEHFLQLIFESSFQYWKYNISMHRSICFYFILVMVSNYVCDTLGGASFKWISFAFLASRNYSPNSVLFGDLFLYVNGLCFRMYWRKIAAATAAAFRGGRGYPYRGGNGFPMHASF